MSAAGKKGVRTLFVHTDEQDKGEAPLFCGKLRRLGKALSERTEVVVPSDGVKDLCRPVSRDRGGMRETTRLLVKFPGAPSICGTTLN